MNAVIAGQHVRIGAGEQRSADVARLVRPSGGVAIAASVRKSREARPGSENN
jgi:hypothetical protein